MAEQLLLGNSEDTLDYNLNEQYSTVSKLLVTSNAFFQGIDDPSLFQSISAYLSGQEEESSLIFSKIDSTESSNEFYKQFQEKIKSLGKEIDVALKNYNFMSSISNTRYTVSLRTKTGTYSRYNIEKTGLIGSMKQLLQKYVETNPNSSNWTQFQFECYISEDIYKKAYVKKEDSQLLLYAYYGCDIEKEFNILGGGELYHSIEEQFFFYKNKQEFAYLRQHGILERKEINAQEKVLNSQELKLINEATRQINNVLMEIYVTKKGGVQVLNVFSNEHPIGNASQKGCVIYKSSKNYDKIALVTLKECGETETANPYYVLIRNDHELQEMMSKLDKLSLDGIVFTYNFYHPFIEYYAEYNDLDIIYYDEPLQRSLEASINWGDFSIEGAVAKNNDNPFSSILSHENKEKDELLEKLKNVDLSTNNNDGEQKDKQYQEIEQLTQSMTASPNSSQGKMANSNTFSSTAGGSQEKKSAIGMLADAALHKQESQNQNQNSQAKSHSSSNGFSGNEGQSSKSDSQSTGYSSQGFQGESQSSTQDFLGNKEGVEVMDENKRYDEQSSYYGFSGEDERESSKLGSENAGYVESSQEQVNKVFGSNQSQVNNEEVFQNSSSLESYFSVLATKLFTPPSFSSQGHVVDSNSISQIRDGGDIILVVSNKEEMQNPSLSYALPVTSGVHETAMALISSPQDYFLLQSSSIFPSSLLINVSVIESEIKSSFLQEISQKYNGFSVIVSKQEIANLEPVISSLDFVYVKDIENDQEVESLRNELLALEKRELMKYLR